MAVRRLAVDAGIVAVLMSTTLLASQSLLRGFGPDAAEKLGPAGMAAWRADQRWWWIATAVGMAALPARSSFPFVTLAGTGFMALAHLMLVGDLLTVMPVDLAAPIAVYTVAAESTRRWLSYTVLLGGVAAACTPRLLGYPPPFYAPWSGVWALSPIAVAVAWLVGDRARIRRAYLDQATERARALERERDQQAELAAAAERARIARELHDAVAHGLSVIVIQAQAAAGALEKRPAKTRAALADIVTTGRDSLAEMRRLLGLTSPDGPELAPLPGLGDLGALVERVRAAGLPVSLTVTGNSVELPTGVDLSAYRIVQEALTNALKHAGPGATVHIEIVAGPDAVELTVTDTGSGVGGAPDERRGNGLRGMRERVAMLSGTLTIGDAPEGGFRVRAKLPVTSPA